MQTLSGPRFAKTLRRTGCSDKNRHKPDAKVEKPVLSASSAHIIVYRFTGSRYKQV
jgi:hypothetical protein